MQKPTARKIALIVVDTQRKDMLGCYGNAGLITPNLDRLRPRQEKTMYEGDGIEDDFTYAHRCSDRAVDFLASRGLQPVFSRQHGLTSKPCHPLSHR